jgi:hypothetical protein
VVFGMMRISNGKVAVIARGMPCGMQVNLALLPCPPLDWSERLASKMA